MRRSFSFSSERRGKWDLLTGKKPAAGGGKENESEEAIGSDAAPPAPRATKRTMVVERGSRGLGLELDATNTITRIQPGGRAEQQGVLLVQDTILSCDGKSLAGMLLQDALALLTSHPSAYVMEVRRPAPTLAPRSQLGVIRRSLSFDRRLR